MIKLSLTWNCDGLGTAKLSENDKLIFDIEYSHRQNSIGWRTGNFSSGISVDRVFNENSLISQTYDNSEFEKKKEASFLKTPISEDFLWTRIWERELTKEESERLKEEVGFCPKFIQ